MRLSPEKSLHLAQLVARRLLSGGAAAGLEVKGVEASLRSQALDTIRTFLQRDEAMAEAARTKIRSLQRKVPEGSAEWDALFRQHYQQEMDRLRKVR